MIRQTAVLFPLLLLLFGCEPATITTQDEPKIGTLEGTVTLGATTGNRGIWVALEGTSSVATTDDLGFYRLTGVPWGGPYTLVASKSGYDEASTEVTISGTAVTTAAPLLLAPVTAKPQRLVTLTGADGTTLWGRESVDVGVHLPRRVTVQADLPVGGAQITYLLTNTARYTERSLADFDPFAPARASRPAVGRRELTGLAASGMAAWTRQKTAPRARALSPAPSPAVVGDQMTFIDALWENAPSTANRHAVTLKGLVKAGGRSLHVWVADGAWATASGAPKTPKTGLTHGVTQAMVDGLAAKFLSDGVNDVYGWVTALYGPEWPDSGAPTGEDGVLIDGGGNIHIFVINLNPEGVAEGTLMGYFHSLNTIVGALGSNEKVLFAINADSLATPDGSSWELSDEWPSETLSTLAHEFQHMIHYYQKQVRHQLERSTDTWIDEMASLVTEDLVADKLGVPGPRGVPSSDLGPGNSGNTSGRIPLFNYWHESIPLQTWLPQDEVLRSYANAYAFGAWLVRNYGGPILFRSLVHDTQTDYHAVVNAVRTTPEGAGQTYESLVSDWGLATFLGDSTSRPFRYRRSNPEGFHWTLDNHTYSAGSLDLRRYRYTDEAGESVDGPWVFDDPTSAASQVSAGATYFQSLGTHQGTFEREVWLPADVVLTVVAEPSK